MLQLIARRESLPIDALYAGHTAAWLHGMNVTPCNPIEVNLPRASQTSHLAGVKLTRSDVTLDEICEIKGLPATGRVRTIADLGRRLPLVDAVAMLDMALNKRLLRKEELHRWASQHPRYWGVSGLKRALGLSEPASESPMETRLRLLLLKAGLPRPRVQVPLYDEDGDFIARPDLYYPEARLALEYDGATHRNSLVADNRRQNRLLDAGYRVLRFTAGDIFNSPKSVAGLVRRSYSMGSPN